jgi:aryl-alcohol dehydrogenase-like predicted oxidoreductase
MERRRLGQSGLAVPAVGMGTWETFDVTVPGDTDQRHALVDVAVRVGSTFFDSSPAYGAAERVLGMTLQGRRERVLVATKLCTPDDRVAEEQIENALGHYAGWVDLYQVHNLVAWPARLAQLERLRDEGRARAIGATQGDSAAFSELERVMRSGRITSIQVPYDAFNRAAELRILPLAEELDLGVVVMAPLRHGTLVTDAPSPALLRPLAPFGVRTWAQALLKWVLSDARVSIVIPATRNPAHALENAAAGEPPWFGPAERAYVARLAEHLPGGRARRLGRAMPAPLRNALRPVWHRLQRHLDYPRSSS